MLRMRAERQVSLHRLDTALNSPFNKLLICFLTSSSLLMNSSLLLVYFFLHVELVGAGNNNAVYLYILIDCPDLLLETKRHIGEGDLRSVVSLYTIP